MAQIIHISEQDIAHIKVNSPEKAYTLGFLWGDAYMTSYKTKTGISQIHYPSLEIVREDLSHIKSLFDVWGNWSCRYRNRSNRKPQGAIILFDRDFGWFLAQNDYLIKSSSEPTKILSIIPEDYKSYWWRGFIDADGCFYHKKYTRQFSIAGAFDITWQETINLFNQLNITKYQAQQRTHKKSKSSAIRLSNKQNIIKLGDYIYSDHLEIGLKRKYDKFLGIKNS